MKHHCPMCGEQWNDDVCAACGWFEGKQRTYSSRDRRKTGEGAMKGWATRRRKMADRRVALDRLIEVADSITSDLTVGERASEPGNRIASALRILEAEKGSR